jgi:hypothetical protein
MVLMAMAMAMAMTSQRIGPVFVDLLLLLL